MKNAELRQQSAAVSPSPNVTALYSDTNGYVYQIASGGLPIAIGSQITGVMPTIAVATGGGGGLVQTGVYFGADNGGVPQTGLGTPALFIPFTHTDGNVYAVPAYSLA